MSGLNRLSKPLEMSPQSVRRNNKFVLVKVSNLWIGVKTQRVNLAICPIFVPNSGFLRCPNRPLLYSNRCVCRSSHRYFRDLEGYTLGLGDIGPEAKILKYTLAHLDFSGKLNSEPDFFFIFFILALLPLPILFLHFAQGKNAQNRPAKKQIKSWPKSGPKLRNW